MRDAVITDGEKLARFDQHERVLHLIGMAFGFGCNGSNIFGQLSQRLYGSRERRLQLCSSLFHGSLRQSGCSSGNSLLKCVSIGCGSLQCGNALVFNGVELRKKPRCVALYEADDCTVTERSLVLNPCGKAGHCG